MKRNTIILICICLFLIIVTLGLYLFYNFTFTHVEKNKSNNDEQELFIYEKLNNLYKFTNLPEIKQSNYELRLIAEYPSTGLKIITIKKEKEIGILSVYILNKTNEGYNSPYEIMYQNKIYLEEGNLNTYLKYIAAAKLNTHKNVSLNNNKNKWTLYIDYYNQEEHVFINSIQPDLSETYYSLYKYFETELAMILRTPYFGTEATYEK